MKHRAHTSNGTDEKHRKPYVALEGLKGKKRRRAARRIARLMGDTDD